MGLIVLGGGTVVRFRRTVWLGGAGWFPGIGRKGPFFDVRLAGRWWTWGARAESFFGAFGGACSMWEGWTVDVRVRVWACWWMVLVVVRGGWVGGVLECVGGGCVGVVCLEIIGFESGRSMVGA